MSLSDVVKRNYDRQINECTDIELYRSVAELIREKTSEKPSETKGKKLYYICAEFLLGRLMVNNLINLGLYDEIKQELEENGKSISMLEELEPEPSLGNGGLGRLAACFMDSIATLGMNGDGVGLLYHFGLFRQQFEDNKQKEYPNNWLEGSRLIHPTEQTYQVHFPRGDIKAKMYDIDIPGFGGGVRKLHLFDADGVDENMVRNGISFDKRAIDKNLTLFLYPDDSDYDGRILRLYQQYFMVSAAAQMIIDECVEAGCHLYDLNDYAVIQLNDTHPTLIIPELIRQLADRGIDMDTAIDVVSKTCAYTNHTILAEALEKWDIAFMQIVVPELLEIIKVLDKKVRDRYKDSSVYIIDGNQVRMAYMAIHYCFRVNGVAKLHTEILKNVELAQFHKIYPDKFVNLTNGITFRRWLLKCNPELASVINDYIGDGYITEPEELKKLLDHVNDNILLEKLLTVKHNNKIALKEYIKKNCDVDIDEESIFDIQVKRLHEYKRQQLNGLYIIYKYLQIKSGIVPKTPITFIFGAKAAPSYVLAKDIIHMLLCLREVINGDDDVNRYIKVFFAENYNVSYAEKLIPACDISEQISLASKEASGTGNMKFMLNGAVTLGTDDGANVEIHSLVGDDNIYIFGAKSNEVISHYKNSDYNPGNIYDSDNTVKKCVDFITSEVMKRVGDSSCLERLKNELIRKDWFMTLLDFKDYIKAKDKAFEDYTDRHSRARRMLVNIANSGYFSSDRTIREYNEKIWNLQ